MPRFTVDAIPDAIAACLPPSARLEFPIQGATADVAFASSDLQSVVIKRCAHPIYLDWLRHESANLQSLSRTPLPIPRLLGYTETIGDAGVEGWLVMTRLAGRSIWEVILETQAPERAPLLFKVGKLLRVLHSTPIPTEFDHQSSWVSRKLIEANDNLTWCDGTAELLEQLTRTQPPSVKETLIHGDAALDNVLIDENGRLSLIDWATADRGDHRCDIALALQCEPETTYVAEELQAFYEGYGGAQLDVETRKWFTDLWDFF